MDKLGIVLGLSTGSLIGAAIVGSTTGMISGMILIILYSLSNILYKAGAKYGKG